jgi:hypothetical protein
MHSAKLVSIADARRDRDERAEDVWDAYVAAKKKADATLDVNDGLAAARAFKRFLEIFVGRL